MRNSQCGRTTLYFLIWLAGIAFSIANVLVLLFATRSSIDVPLATELYRVCAPCVLYFAVAPLVVALLQTILSERTLRSPATPGPAVSVAPPAPAEGPARDDAASAVALLALLQREGRFLDFLAEDLAPYSDAQIGAAARAVHAGCRKALEGRVAVQPIVEGQEGQEVTVEAGFDPNQIRLSGNVPAAGPYRGVLRHPGWKLARLDLPKPVPGSSSEILAPAEVDIA